MPAASLRALLEHSIDYAGLFPPASLALEPALRNYARYVRDPDAWMLGPFILPVAQFAAATGGLSQFDGQHPFRVSALGARAETAEAFLQSLSAAMDSIASFQDAGKAVIVEQFEIPLPADLSRELFHAIKGRVRTELAIFLETPARYAARAIALIAESNAANGKGTLGFKLRTGGVTADAFPASAEIAAVLVAARDKGVPIKFTAGLHHPVRLFHESVGTKMHGFLNVLGAGVLALVHQWPEEQITQMLDDEDPASFSFNYDSFRWRDWKISTGEIAAGRNLVTSLGSCSFDEPRDDLRALKLL